MKNIYIAVLAVLGISIILFFASFAYLDAIKHQTFHFVVNLNGKDVGTIRVDRFITDERIIYKSAMSTPLDGLFTEYRSRLSLDKDYELENYTKERSTGRVTDTYYIENFKHLISFVSRYQSKFSFLDNIPIRKHTFYFEDDSPLTYMPIIENYDFSKGRAQGFNAISCLYAWSLPPVKRFVTFTSIRDEYIKIGSKKIEAENLLLKMRDYPQGMIWVSKSDHSLIKLNIPQKGLVITRTFNPKTFHAQEKTITPEGYLSTDVSFKNKNTDLFGTITYPARHGKFPAVILANSGAPQDRQCQGLFTFLADYLSKNGYAVLRFDKHAAGTTTDDMAYTTDSREIEDLSAAVQYMKTRDFVDTDKLVLLGHARGALYALKRAADDQMIKGLIMIAPDLPLDQDKMLDIESMRKSAQGRTWSDDYRALIIRGAKENLNTLAANEGDFAYILGKKCFLSDMREELADKPLDTAKKLKIPVLILQGALAENTQTDAAALLDTTIADSGNTKHTLTYYAYLGQYFGNKISDGIHRAYYETDPAVLENIKKWLSDLIV